MKIVCTDTNASVGGCPVPVGWGDLPLGGLVAVTWSGGSNNFVVGAGDTLAIAPSGVTVIAGFEPGQAFVAGFAMMFVLIAVVGLARRSARLVAFGPTRSDL